MTTQKYQDATQLLLQQAQSELAAGDVRQAAEKAWGSAAQAIKAYCSIRGWSHQTHVALRRAVSRIANEQDDNEFRLLFKAANLMHVNFYEDMYTAEYVQEGIDEVQHLIDKLDALP